MDFWPIWFILGGVILVLMTALWLLSLAVKNASIVDSFWGMGFVILTWAAYLLTGGQGTPERKLLLNTLYKLNLETTNAFFPWMPRK